MSRLSTVNRDSGRPTLIAWFCRGHSPPLSHTGQSSGWFSSKNSMTPSWAIARNVGGVLGVDLHAIADHLRARRLRLGHPLDLDQAGAAGGDRVQKRVVAKARDLDAEHLSGADDQRALRNTDRHAIDDHRDQFTRYCYVGTRIVRDGHRAAAPANT